MNSIELCSLAYWGKDDRKENVRATVYRDEPRARREAREARSTVQQAKVTKRVIRADCVRLTVWVVTVRER